MKRILVAYFSASGVTARVAEKMAKALRKTTDLAEFRSITKEIFHNLPVRAHLQPDW